MASRTPRRFQLRSVCTVALVALASTLSLTAHAACKLENVEMPIRMVGSRAIATVGINGTPVPLTVDSGAYFSVLTDAAAAQLNLPTKKNSIMQFEGITGKIDTRVTHVDQLRLFNGDTRGFDFVVGGNDPGSGTMGLLGRNILSSADTEYDLAHGMIRFHSPSSDCADANMAYWAGDAPVTEVDLVPDYQTRLPAIRARVKLNGTEFIALLDTGATSAVSTRAARRAGVAESAWTPAGLVYGAGRGNSKAWTAGFDKFEIGGESITRNRLLVADFDLSYAEMLLGIDFFLAHRIYVSRERSKMFITYNGGPVFALDRTPNGSAAASGLDVPEAAAASTAAAKTADEFARRGAASAARRDYDAALADVDRAVELEPTSAAFLVQRGTIEESLKRLPKAREDFDKALELDPTQADARFHRAVLRLLTKDRDGAKVDFDALDKTLAPQAPMRLPMSTYYFVLEQPALALAQLNQWLPAHPNEVRRDAALNARCRARLLLNVELDQALDDCDDAVGSDGKNANYLDLRGWVYLRLGRNQKAISDFDRSLAIRPNSAATLYGRGLAKTRSGDAGQGDVDLAAARKLQADVERRVTRNGLLAGMTATP